MPDFSDSFSEQELLLMYSLVADCKNMCKDALQKPAPGTTRDDIAQAKSVQSVARSASRKLSKMLQAAGVDTNSLDLR